MCSVLYISKTGSAWPIFKALLICSKRIYQKVELTAAWWIAAASLCCSCVASYNDKTCRHYPNKYNTMDFHPKSAQLLASFATFHAYLDYLSIVICDRFSLLKNLWQTNIPHPFPVKTCVGLFFFFLKTIILNSLTILYFTWYKV